MKNMTWLGYLNFIILQWFCIRLARTGKIIDGEFNQEGWKIIKYVFPLTGWWNDYVYMKGLG